MTILRFLLSNFHITHAPLVFQPVLKCCKQLCTINTILVVTTSYFTILQLREHTEISASIQKNNASTPSNQLIIASNNEATKRDTTIHEGFLLMRQSDCYTCHADQKVMTAPSYIEIAEKYRKEKNVEGRLVNKVIQGGKGEWGTDRAMNPHPELLRDDALKMIEYILQLKAIKASTTAPAKSQ